MIFLSYSSYPFKTKKEKDTTFIFDEIRKRWFVLTPEEWVRQNFVQYLLQLNYPKALIAIEKVIVLNDTRKRFDIVVYKNDTPWMLVECKEMTIPLTQKVLQQVINYNQKIDSHFMVITNGNQTMAWQLKPILVELDGLPEY